MKTLQTEMIVTQLVLSRHGSEATIRTTPRTVVLGRPCSSIEGEITIRSLELRPGQRIKAEFHIIEEEDERQQSDAGELSITFNELP